MNRIILLLLCTMLSAPAMATLFCYDYELQEGFEWNAGVFNPTIGPLNHNYWRDLSPRIGGPQVYCWANSGELAYIQNHFTGLRSRSGPSKDGQDTNFWMGEDAVFIMNNL
jgi:hypothetical protein